MRNSGFKLIRFDYFVLKRFRLLSSNLTSIQFQTIALLFSACGKECEESPDSETGRDAGRNSRVL